MNLHAWRNEPKRQRRDHERVSELLDRYPNVSNDEAREILTFVQAGRYFDVGLLTSNSRLRPSLDAFVKDHRSHFDVEPARGQAAVCALILLHFVAWAIWTVLA